MAKKNSNLGVGKKLRQRRNQVGGLSEQAEKQLEQHLFGRFERLSSVRRFVIGWAGLLVLLIIAVLIQNLMLSGYYQSVKTVPGGIYNEGVIGRFTNASPLFATSDADTTVSKLIFAGLLTYNDQGQLIGDLAENFTESEHGTVYTVKLKPNLTWHDGQPLTSADVVFTYKLIQNPDVQSPLLGGWQGIDVSAPDNRTVVFKIPDALASFPYSLTNGIVPQHLLAKVPPTDLRSADFNTIKPIGAGPFIWQAIHVTDDGKPNHTQSQVALRPFENYQAGKPKLQKFVVQIFADKKPMQDAFNNRQLSAVEGLLDSSEIKINKRVQKHNFTLRAGTYVFYKTTQGVLADSQVRQALVKGVDVPKIISKLDYKPLIVKEPFLTGQLGYDPQFAQSSYDPNGAKKILETAGWVVDKNGQRTKGGKKLNFSLTAADTPDSRQVTSALKKQWSELGVVTNLQLLSPGDFQNALNGHGYEAIMYGITIGADPDVFVYWHSSQADIRTSRLNLSEYKSETADAALEAGRTRLDPTLRAIKYRPFLETWQKDSPALGLYQPRVLYITNGFVDGLGDQPINTATDRFNDVHNWKIRQAKVTN